jgi:hypothetical protein
MDFKPDDITAIIKSATEVVKTGGELVGALKLTEIGKAMLGEATAEIAESLRDKVRLYRFGNQLKAIKKAEKMVADAGFTPKAVPIKLLFPLLEGASLEDNEDLHTMWSSLLANSASRNFEKTLRPGFIAILRQLAPDEAIFLNWAFDSRDALLRDPELSSGSGLLKAAGKLGLLEYDDDKGTPTGPSTVRFLAGLDGLVAQQLIVHDDRKKRYAVSFRGQGFVSACRPPAPKSEEKS